MGIWPKPETPYDFTFDKSYSEFTYMEASSGCECMKGHYGEDNDGKENHCVLDGITEYFKSTANDIRGLDLDDLLPAHRARSRV